MKKNLCKSPNFCRKWNTYRKAKLKKHFLSWFFQVVIECKNISIVKYSTIKEQLQLERTICLEELLQSLFIEKFWTVTIPVYVLSLQPVTVLVIRTSASTMMKLVQSDWVWTYTDTTTEEACATIAVTTLRV